MGQDLRNIDKGELSSTPLDAFNIIKCDPGAFTGGVAGTRGAFGTRPLTPLFKITGTVLVRIFGVAKLTLVGAGTVEVGVPGNTAALLAQITDATALLTGEIYTDATPTTAYVDPLSDVTGPYIVTDAGAAAGITIDEKVGTANITAGGLFYILLWRPLTPNGNVESLFTPSNT